jgi:1-acyl-sn-glycerol-3-phosphate acyltransferase
MDTLPYATPPRWWSPNLRPFFVRAIRPFRILRQRWREGVYGVEVRGLEHLREPVAREHGVIITPNHVAHSDPFVLLRAGDALGRFFCYMVAWQSFPLLGPVGSWVIRRHGSFSVHREGNDLRAFKQAVSIVKQGRHPLVLFAEGEVYHNGEQVTPFRQGAAAVALAAVRRARRPVVCVPAAIRYRFLKDPTPELLPLVDAMERKLLGKPRPGVALAARLAHLAETVLLVGELRFLGQAGSGPFALRATTLTEAILCSLEEQHGAPPAGCDVPERVRRLRQSAIRQKEAAPSDDARAKQAARDLDAVNAAVRYYSYTHDYLSDEPTIEHLAEIVDKFEEDLLGVTTARARGRRRAVIQFGPPIPAAPFQEQADGVRALTEALEQQVRALLAGLLAERRFVSFHSTQDPAGTKRNAMERNGTHRNETERRESPTA